MRTVFVVVVEHGKPIPDLVDKVAGRAYTMPGVSDVHAWVPDAPLLERIVAEMPPQDPPRA